MSEPTDAMAVELPSGDDLDRADRQQDIGMKRVYGYALLAAMLLQVFIADAVFVKYAASGAG